MNALATLASDAPAADTITPGVLGFIAIAGIGLALYFLMKSMRKRLAAIQVEPDAPAESRADARSPGRAASTESPDSEPGPTAPSA
ncbi:hypothetical protein FZ103_00905 [Streptomonospora sp. PA3]|uniref:hypothetical protein n=1 Tax=Streptomonospora sp. PA3 TaxID=2607326 RepID=UPI0012DCD73A|nr:hypothetical protein [Streptomonospora sp. PA3]MUL39750.1 hypothetical protein [Streptomonospora sp. PA3]